MLIEIYGTAEKIEAVVRVIAEILDHENGAIAADRIVFASGLCTIQGGISLMDLAQKYGVAKQALSNRVTECGDRFGLPPSGGMKDKETQESYRDHAHRMHGTKRNPEKKVGKRLRTIIASAGYIAQWHSKRGEMPELSDTQKLILKRAFASLEPACKAVAQL